MRVAVCFACDEAYMPLCKGLVLSLLDAKRFHSQDWRVSLHFIDIGCRRKSLAFLKNLDVDTHVFDRARFLPGIRGDQAPAYADAQLCRLFLPDIVPGHDVYLWIDCDIWTQGHDVAPVVANAAAHTDGKMVVCPELHCGYIEKRNLRFAVMAHNRWYSALYGAEVAGELSFKPMFNSGFFAMRENSDVWGSWGEELARIYSEDRGEDREVLHFAEQFGLTYVLQRDRTFVLLGPIFNHACGGSAVLMNPQGKITVGLPPFSPVKCIHLLNFPRYGRMYLEKNFLYRKGEYLSAAEREILPNIGSKTSS